MLEVQSLSGISFKHTEDIEKMKIQVKIDLKTASDSCQVDNCVICKPLCPYPKSSRIEFKTFTKKKVFAHKC